MKLCRSCHKNGWPYLFAFFIAGFVSLLTWLTLSTESISNEIKLLCSAGAFLTIFIILLSYMIACMRRHCAHENEHAA
uniref:Uncharacterized protein n=1 Tax=Candidatus Kentrum sp. TUN TaxID=2126343 RepID=A0A450ZK23_9GAMM|nr:MAG: hypothetical protein BECKTUN1418D_GA0071000_100115 [Candidatus Kentron sp. TUN]VFK54163.1 MAG: hypothetical protein BECKTUN1418F_GA0071002_103815 [Candidatus Kentron sp. TUN]VFK56197.1 MAG: hypothetical protein BECKTUN1418E_GA0071001_103815 [Candidatus Kentron sp. TUN]